MVALIETRRLIDARANGSARGRHNKARCRQALSQSQQLPAEVAAPLTRWSHSCALRTCSMAACWCAFCSVRSLCSRDASAAAAASFSRITCTCAATEPTSAKAPEIGASSPCLTHCFGRVSVQVCSCLDVEGGVSCAAFAAGQSKVGGYATR